MPTINDQALIRLACDMSSALAGLVYFIYIAKKMHRKSSEASDERVRPGIKAFKVLGRPSVYTFTESAIRNSLYLWLVSRIISLGENYGTAWGVFNTIRWGLVMVPVQALEASTLAFVGHNWGQWRARVGVGLRKPKASRQDLLGIIPLPIFIILLILLTPLKDIMRPAFISCAIALLIEIPVCISLSLWGMESFAYYLSDSTEVALITKKMWKVSQFPSPFSKPTLH